MHFIQHLSKTIIFVYLEPKKGKPSTKSASKGNHSSCNAYMLVYSRKGAVVSDDPKKQVLADSASVLPEWVQSALKTENENFEAWNQTITNRKVNRSSLMISKV